MLPRFQRSAGTSYSRSHHERRGNLAISPVSLSPLYCPQMGVPAPEGRVLECFAMKRLSAPESLHTFLKCWRSLVEFASHALTSDAQKFAALLAGPPASR